jgi:phosphatidylethanolamine/phosphatidyl-N-methylethanolamine N-methyltransferase
MSDAKARLRFLLAFMRDPLSTGSLTPSSRSLGRELIEPLTLAGSSKILEIGPGTGAVTQIAYERLGHLANYHAVELNPKFVEGLRRRFPHFHFSQGSAEELKQFGVAPRSMDSVVSAIPWTLLSPTTRGKILSEIQSGLKDSGVFTTFLYWHLLKLPLGKKIEAEIRNHFGSVSRSPVIWHNFPPAVVLTCKNPIRES